MNRKKRIIVIGGGFGGLNFCKNIDKDKYDVTIIDRNNFHSFPPLFYQVASGSLEPASISFPLRREIRSRRMKGCEYNYGDIRAIDSRAHTVTTQYETLRYDLLVIAAGTTNNFFGIDGLRERVYTIKSTAEAIRCRNAILLRLEQASIEKDETIRHRLLTFTVVGGGPTGVEIAGALGEMKRYIVPREYPSIRPDEVRVILVDSSDRVLRQMSAESSADALKALGSLMVEVRLGKTMKSYDGHGRLIFTDDSTIETGTVIWTAGVTAVSFEFTGDKPVMAPGGRFAVDEYNKVEGTDDIYAVGDIAYHSDPAWPHGCPQLAQGAIQQGVRLAKNLNRPEAREPFVYKDKGTMATIGRNRAVVDMGRIHFDGWPAWMTWMAVHLMGLLGMRNKAIVLINWIWSYLTFTSTMRLIIPALRCINPTGHSQLTTKQQAKTD